MRRVHQDFENMLLLSSSFKKKYDGFFIMKYGSSVNGLGSKLTSDLDLTILTKHQDSEIVLNDLVGVLKKYGNQRYEFTLPRRDRAGWILNFRDNIL
jgi:predicted nucleotidyltransferase